MQALFVSSVMLPLVGGLCAAALLAFPSWRWRVARGVTLTLIVSALCALGALALFDGQPRTIVIMPWIVSGDVAIEWSLSLDALSIVMVALVTSVAALIHVYALDYMKDDASLARFFCYLSLFTFAMLMLVSGGNLLVLFFGWEGVGLCSYWLIGFWHTRRTASVAAVKAFVYNRFGDTAFMVGLVGLAVLTQTLQWQAIESWVELNQSSILVSAFAACLLAGAMAKSAQWLLHGWLADAMEGPTPVSALLHAATMVTAGVFLIIRMQPLFVAAPIVMDVIMVVGAVTALFSAMTACAQYDIKRMIAWSTCSQIGYMFIALGAAAWGAALFHLVTHAFFKALLFLAAGSVIHALHGEQDIRRMARLGPFMPFTFAAMTIAALALMGMPLLSGFYSKEAILEAVWHNGSSVALFAWGGGLLAAFLTAIYATRLIVVPFLSRKTESFHYVQPHEASSLMLVPMMLLAVAAIFMGWATHHYFLGSSSHHAAQLIRFLPLGMAGVGILLALVWFLGRISFPARVQSWIGFVRRGWNIDRLYHVLWGRGCERIAHSCVVAEKEVIDQLGPDGIAQLVKRQSAHSAQWQKAGLAVYSFFLIMLVTLLLTWYGFTFIGVGSL